MSFDNTYRYFAFSSTILQSANALRDKLGDLASTAPDRGGESVKTLLCGLDNSDTGKLRALILGHTAMPIHLSDGRICFGGYWAQGAVDEFLNGNIEGEEISAGQVKSLSAKSAAQF